MILVTGGTGLVGSHLLYQLTQQNEPIRAIYRNKNTLTKVAQVFGYYTDTPEQQLKKIEWVQADINDLPALEIAFEEITTVFHCAAFISFEPKHWKQLQKINIEGTANIVNISIDNKIKKIVYVSSIAAVSPATGSNIAVETNPWINTDVTVYARSKYLAELEIWRAVQEGVPVAVLNPGIIIGPGFWTSGSGKLFTTAAKSIRYAPPSGTGFITANDVAKLLLKLQNTSHVNQRFIAVSENISYQKVLTCIAEALKTKAPKKVLTSWQLQLLWRADWLWCLLTKRKRTLSKNNATGLLKTTIYDNSKAKELLSFTFEPIVPALQRTAAFFKMEN